MAMAAAPTARPSTKPLLLAVERDVDSSANTRSGAAVGVQRAEGKDVAVERSLMGAADAGDFVGDADSDANAANGAMVGVIRDTGKDVGAKAGAVGASLVGARDSGDAVNADDSDDNATKGAVVGRGKDISSGVGAADASWVGARVTGDLVDCGMRVAVRGGGSRHELEKFEMWD
jgi:hypothetical protein